MSITHDNIVDSGHHRLYYERIPIKESRFEIQLGIVYNYSVSHLVSGGFIQCYGADYNNPTTTADLVNCSHTTSKFFFVGAIKRNAPSYFAIGAFGNQLVFSQTFSSSSAEFIAHGLYWYYVAGQSFGFSPIANIDLAPCDFATLNCSGRLCWHVDELVGGYRAGCVTSLNNDPTWEKSIYRTSPDYSNTGNNTYKPALYPSAGGKTSVSENPTASITSFTPTSSLASTGSPSAKPMVSTPSVAPTSSVTRTRSPSAKPMVSTPSVTPTSSVTRTRSPSAKPMVSTPSVTPTSSVLRSAHPTMTPSHRQQLTTVPTYAPSSNNKSLNPTGTPMAAQTTSPTTGKALQNYFYILDIIAIILGIIAFLFLSIVIILLINVLCLIQRRQTRIL